MIAGDEFLDEKGKVFIVRRALYGLTSAPQAFRSFLAEHIEDLNFFPSEADPDVWMRPAQRADGTEYYEYVLCYVDDILCISADSMGVMKQLQSKFKFKNDKIEPPENYLGARVRYKEVDGFWMWTISSVDYMKAAVVNVKEGIEKKRWKLPSNPDTPMATSYTPELDETPELNDDDRTYYQELIGILRWATELGRVDILHEVSILSQYQACPRDGHMQQLLRIFSFLGRYPKMSIYMDYRRPDLSSTQQRSTQEEFRRYYRDAEEELPRRMPVPKGEPVVITVWVDASHAANKKTRKSHTGYIIFVNCAPIIWYSKRQNTVEASTFGSEFIAMKSSVEAVTYLRYKLRMFGIPLEKNEPAHVICDNESVVNNSTLVESTLNKKHNSIAYHYVRWNVAAGVIRVSWIPSGENLSDPLTKRLGHEQRDYLFGGWTY